MLQQNKNKKGSTEGKEAGGDVKATSGKVGKKSLFRGTRWSPCDQPHFKLMAGDDGYDVRSFVPALAEEFKSVGAALIYTQIMYMTQRPKYRHEGEPVVRLSNTAWAKQFPFFGESTIKVLLNKLEAADHIYRIRGDRVSLTGIKKSKLTEEHVTADAGQLLLVFPRLATEVGLNEAIVLQQVHLRTAQLADGEEYLTQYGDLGYWTKKSASAWAEVFRFWSEDTIKRTFKKLVTEGYLRTKKLSVETGQINGYRVNYPRLVEKFGAENVRTPPSE